MSNANRALIHRWFEEVWNQGREETIDELLSPNGLGYGLGDTDITLKGPAEFKPFVRNLRGSFPDIHITIDDTVVEGDRVVVRIHVDGTHTGNGLGVPPSGRRIRIAGMVEVRISNGQIVEGWNSWDQFGLLRQIGALPVHPGPDRFAAAG
jgi:steroid delta-isomerase-like uncharacterized protein